MFARVQGCLKRCSSDFQLSLAKVTLNFNCVQNTTGFFPSGLLFWILRHNQKLNLCKHLSLVCTYMIKCYDFWNNGCIGPICDVEIISCVAHISLLREHYCWKIWWGNSSLLGAVLKVFFLCNTFRTLPNCLQNTVLFYLFNTYFWDIVALWSLDTVLPLIFRPKILTTYICGPTAKCTLFPYTC